MMGKSISSKTIGGSTLSEDASPGSSPAKMLRWRGGIGQKIPVLLDPGARMALTAEDFDARTFT